jgi:dCMP deaminase
MSRAVRLQVGSVIVKNDNILAFSWNGTPAGWDNNCEDAVYMDVDNIGASSDEIYKMWPYIETEINFNLGYARQYALKTKPEVLHAEMNCLMKLTKTSQSGEGSSMFTSHAPCIDCAKAIYQAGIKDVYYLHDYKSSQGIEFLKKSNIPIEKLNLK